MHARKVLVSVALVACVLLPLLGFGASAAIAHGPGTNGCTAVPDSGYGFNFHDGCDRHDRCYGERPYGDGWSGRRACDRAFRSDMLQYCKRHRYLSVKRAVCNTVASTYYLGVRLFGYSYWNAGVSTPIA